MMAKKKKQKKKVDRVDGVPISAIKKMLVSPDTPAQFKVAWANKLQRMGVKL